MWCLGVLQVMQFHTTSCNIASACDPQRKGDDQTLKQLQRLSNSRLSL
jgi:hypothetical protein